MGNKTKINYFEACRRKAAPEVMSEDLRDFSDEFLMMMAAAGYMVFGAQLIINTCARECDIHDLKDSFFQKKKMYIKKACDGFDAMAKALSAGFDDWFDTVWKEDANKFRFVHSNSNDMAKLALLFLSRADNMKAKRDACFSAIRELPVDQDCDADWGKVINYFNMKI